jgi:hypothetical protein
MQSLQASRVQRHVITVEVFAIYGPGRGPAAFDVEGTIRDSIQGNDHASPGIWLVAGESESTHEDLKPCTS